MEFIKSLAALVLGIAMFGGFTGIVYSIGYNKGVQDFKIELLNLQKKYHDQQTMDKLA